jgi:hypothetical protein
MLIIVVAMVGCTTIKGDWEKAQISNSISSYHYFLSKYPNSNYTPEAKDRIESLEWEKAQQINAVVVYQKFVKTYPESSYAEEAKFKIKKLMERATKNIKVVRLVISQDYGDAHVNLPIGEVAKKFLGYAGLRVVKSNAEVYDATLSIWVKGKALYG